ncbi:LamB/YcsF family protein [Acinetobacter sp. NIPH 1852]|uniref:LamB/YcsF family protein n=1 Tax=Acinetobacter sp. NIPH 1852 TaxID=2923428 RepID=UPI001F4B2A88|nr:5-oxoprolinase subunit PxpA [Acinetobacter sp. NIPH 1852]MCH7307249.1 LamB/YcsF family protein [Acinetobacter sp. NIPH 1852]
MYIDLNSDLGESYGSWSMGNDEQILPIVSSANIACGFHAGDPLHILKTLKQAAKFNVNVGAHVSYPDLVGFGRRKMTLSYDELLADVLYQISALHGLAHVAGTRVSYVKPHGALYNTIATDLNQAQAVIDAILQFDADLTLVALAGSPLIDFAQKQGLTVVSEAFADRAYHDDGSLVSRYETGAVLHDAKIVAQRVLDMILKGGVESIEGNFTPIQADTICLHGDTTGAVQLATVIRQALIENQIEVRAFCM